MNRKVVVDRKRDSKVKVKVVVVVVVEADGGWRMYRNVRQKSTMKKMHSQDRSRIESEENEKKKCVLYRTMIVMIYSTWRGI